VSELELPGSEDSSPEEFSLEPPVPDVSEVVCPLVAPVPVLELSSSEVEAFVVPCDVLLPCEVEVAEVLLEEACEVLELVALELVALELEPLCVELLPVAELDADESESLDELCIMSDVVPSLLQAVPKTTTAADANTEILTKATYS
jgi:hypothetical protein